MQLTTIFPTASEYEAKFALMVAARLRELVKQNPFYHEPIDTVHIKVRAYLRKNIPGLSDKLYFLAENEIMQMYIL